MHFQISWVCSLQSSFSRRGQDYVEQCHGGQMKLFHLKEKRICQKICMKILFLKYVFHFHIDPTSEKTGRVCQWAWQLCGTQDSIDWNETDKSILSSEYYIDISSLLEVPGQRLKCVNVRGFNNNYNKG